MNTITRLGRTAMPGISTDQTAFSVNRFLAQRPALTSRPEPSEQRRPATAPVPPEVLYPSLYAEHSSLIQRFGAYLRAIVITLGNRQSPNATHTS
jgi:hypothetical protein